MSGEARAGTAIERMIWPGEGEENVGVEQKRLAHVPSSRTRCAAFREIIGARQEALQTWEVRLAFCSTVIF